MLQAHLAGSDARETYEAARVSEMTTRSFGPLASGSGRHRIWLRFEGKPDFELARGVTIVGRGDGCQLILDDPLISRRHACFVVDDRDVTVKDLGSTNGVLVNGVRIDELCIIVPGDYITLGPYHAELCWVPYSSTERAPAPREMHSGRPAIDTMVDRRPSGSSVPPPRSAEAESTGEGSVLQMLSGVAEKAFELGRGSDADRMLRRPLEALLVRVESGAEVESVEVARAGLLATRLARATGQGQWIDYVFRLFHHLRQLPPSVVIDELHSAVRAAHDVRLGDFRHYLETLRAMAPGFGPAERFLLRRLESLEGMLAS